MLKAYPEGQAAFGRGADADLRAGRSRVNDSGVDRRGRQALWSGRRCRWTKWWAIIRCCTASRMGKYHVQVCTNISCMLVGGEELYEHAKKKLGIGHKEGTADGQISLEEVECMGACSWAPAVEINYDFHHYVTPEQLDQADRRVEEGAITAQEALQRTQPAGNASPEQALRTGEFGVAGYLSRQRRLQGVPQSEGDDAGGRSSKK